MEPRPIRMPDELWQAIEEDAREKNRMAAEHVRQICREYLEADEQHIHERLNLLEQRVDRLEEQNLAGETSQKSTDGTESQEAPGRAAEDVEPVEDVDDVLVKARQEFEERHDAETVERILTAGEVALETLGREEQLTADEFRERLADEYPVPGQDEEAWWHESVEPVLEIAQDWGLVVSSHGYKYEWVGAPA